MSSTIWICQDTFWFWWPTSSGFMEVMRSGCVLLWQSWSILSASLNTPLLIGKSEICVQLSQTQYPAVKQYSKIPFVIPGVKQCCIVALEWRKRSCCVKVGQRSWDTSVIQRIIRIFHLKFRKKHCNTFKALQFPLSSPPNTMLKLRRNCKYQFSKLYVAGSITSRCFEKWARVQRAAEIEPTLVVGLGRG